MPQYVSLAQQGFFTPFQMLQEGLQARANRKLASQQLAQQQQQWEGDQTLRRSADERAAAQARREATKFTDVDLPMETLKLGEMRRAKDVSDAFSKALPDIHLAPEVGIPERVEFLRSQVPGARYEELLGAARQSMQGSLPAGYMPPVPQGMQAQQGKVDPVTGQLQDITLGPKIDMSLLNGGASGGGVDGSWRVSPDGKSFHFVAGTPKIESVKAVLSAVNANPTAKAFIEARDAFSRLDGIMGLGGQENGMQDASIIYSFIRSLDPGSAVREGEIGFVKKGIPGFTRLELLAKNLWTGQMMTPGVRSDIKRAAASAVAGLQPSAKGAVEGIGQMFGELPEQVRRQFEIPENIQAALAADGKNLPVYRTREEADSHPEVRVYRGPSGQFYTKD